MIIGCNKKRQSQKTLPLLFLNDQIYFFISSIDALSFCVIPFSLVLKV